MRIRRPVSIARGDTASPLWRTLKTIQKKLEIDDQALAEMLDLSPKQMTRQRSRRKAPSLHAIDTLSSVLGVPLEAILEGTLDWGAVVAQAKGNPAYLPERYTLSPLSRRRTSVNLLEYIAKFYGHDFKIDLLRSLQVREQAFANPDSLINIHFLKDLCAGLVGAGFQPSALVRMGAYSVVMNRGGAVGELLRGYRDVATMHEVIFTEVVSKYFDRNYRYRILELHPDSCLIEATENRELLDAFGVAHIGSPEICLTKIGAFSSLTGYRNLPYSKVTEIKCVHRGDPSCRYLIEFYPALHNQTILQLH